MTLDERVERFRIVVRTRKALINMKPPRSVTGQICAVAGPTGVACVLHHERAYRIVVDVCDDAGNLAIGSSPIICAIREDRPDPRVAFVDPFGEGNVDAPAPRRKRFVTCDRRQVDVVAHQRVRDTAPVCFEQRTTEPTKIFLAMLARFQKPATIDESPDEVMNKSWDVQTSLSHARVSVLRASGCYFVTVPQRDCEIAYLEGVTFRLLLPSPFRERSSCRPSRARGPRGQGHRARACRGCGSHRHLGRRPPSLPRALRSCRRSRPHRRSLAWLRRA